MKAKKDLYYRLKVNDIKKKRYLLFILLFLFVTACSSKNTRIAIQPVNESNIMTVYFINVGQGNCVLAEDNGHYMLIDGGDRKYSSFLVSYLKKLGVKKFDYVIASHYDEDHLSGIVSVLKNFNTEYVLDPDYKTNTRIYRSFRSSIKKETDEIHPGLRASYSFGDADFTIVAPVKGSYGDYNDESIGIKLEYGKNSFLICGDAGEQSEEDMVQNGESLKSTVYLMNHHGSGSSSTEDFLDGVNPEYAVISCGIHNEYGHPHEDTMQKLKKHHIKFFRTDEQGTIIAYSNKKKVTWNKSPSMDFRSGDEITANK